jgi:argininosuccinate lyase
MKIDKLWGSRLQKNPAEGLLAFTVGRDMQPTPPYDERLLLYDLWGSRAHAIMLWKQKILSKKDVKALLKGLDEVENSCRNGTFTFDTTKEDVHSVIESYLIKHYGMEAAGKIHTGRSRNDQVVVDMRLYMRAELLEYVSLLLELIESLVEVAREHLDAIMPGYTHHQPAMITSFGHLLFSYALALERDVKRFTSWYSLFNFNPLGGAAGYGTGIPVDRDLTARLLAFDGVHESSLDPSQNRWEPEEDMCHTISTLMNHLSSLSQTLILLSTEEFGIVELDDAYCTGSSIMPQKRNPDALEVIKGKASYVKGMAVTLSSLGDSLFAGYNRDTQWSKYPIVDVIDECKPALKVMKDIITSLTFNREAALKCCEKGFIAATDVLEWLVKTHVLPLREAKVAVEKAVAYSEEEGSETITPRALKRSLREIQRTVSFKDRDVISCQKPKRVIQERVAAGGPSPQAMRAGLNRFKRALKKQREWLEKRFNQIEQAQKEVRKITRSLS